MYKTLWMLALLTISVGLVNSLNWDIVVAVENRLEFYDHETLTHSEDVGMVINNLMSDAAHNRLLFIDVETSRNVFLYTFNLETMELQSLAMRKANQTGEEEVIRSLAYDPVTESVFWIQSNAIFWFSLKPGFKNNIYGNLLMELQLENRETLSGIAVDSCRGYIYWTKVKYSGMNSDYYTKIEKARLDGSDSEVVIEKTFGSINVLVIDQQTQKIYWSVEAQSNEAVSYYEGPPFYFYIESTDLNEENTNTLYYSDTDTQYSTIFPFMLTVSNDSIYWVNRHGGWKLQKNYAFGVQQPKIEKMFNHSFLFYDLATNYKIEDQTQNVQDCEALISKSSVFNADSLCIPTDESLICKNYCFQGNCSISDKGQPICRCESGYSGERCEVNLCQHYCLNDGICSLNEENKPVCKCRADYEGERCDVLGCLNRLNKHFHKVAMLRDVVNADVTPACQDKSVKTTCAELAELFATQKRVSITLDIHV